MKIENSVLRFSTANSQSEVKEYQRAGTVRTGTAAQGRVIGQVLDYGLQENVRIQSGQSAYLYSRSQISGVNAKDAPQVISHESLLQSMVSYAFSRNVRVIVRMPG